MVPPNIREAIGKTNWIKSWPPGTSIAQIEREAKRLAAIHDQTIAATRVGNAEDVAKQLLAGSPGDVYWYLDFVEQGEKDFGLRRDPQTAAIIRAIEGGGTYYPEVMPLTAALERDLNVYSADKDPRPFRYAIQSFVDTCGDLGVTHIERRHVTDWLAAQRRDGLSPATVKRRYGTIKALVGRAMLDLGSDRRNPFDGFKMTEGDGTTKRVPFSRAMLELIEDYLVSGRVGFEVVALIRIMRATGGTIGEVGGLAVDDVILDHATPHLLIRPNQLRRLKSAARTRPVPLVDSAALEAVTEAVEAGGNTSQVFPGFHLERGADLLSAKVVKAIRAAGVHKSPRLTAHSFRHTVAEALRVSGASYHLQRRILGHASRDESDMYGSPVARLEELAGAMEKALEHLGEVDDSNYTEQERMI
ncbi:MAG: tyrosine-type recombinase/integrase [Alphaproteobacteria bacterium]|nr:tyrosine-type recombinase/integrase [Alphaproteobacteria bacterium]